MRARLVATLLATVMTLAFMPGVASADEPLDVDCDVLESTLVAVDGVLPAGTFSSWGDLLSTAKADPATFAFLNGLVFAFSGGTISFDSAGEVTPTIATCGLMSLAESLVRT